MDDVSNNIKAIAKSVLKAKGQELNDVLYEISDLVDGQLLEVDSKHMGVTLIELYQGVDDTTQQSTIMWICGRLYRHELKSFFIESLRSSLDVDSELMWQCIISLENIGEAVLPEGSGSSNAAAENKQHSLAYLSQLN